MAATPAEIAAVEAAAHAKFLAVQEQIAREQAAAERTAQTAASAKAAAVNERR
ncbi:hypothetical protein [Streptomyces pseudogriseolus]|uniref:hypothetical protein n=1 Tax=Streptomyces pseudogriseolus TaxID=36817 RepID=UPI003FA2CF31